MIDNYIEDSINFLNHGTLLNDKIDIAIEAFVKFYGENRRSEIEDKLRNVTIMKFGDKDAYEYKTEDIKETILEKVLNISLEIDLDGILDLDAFLDYIDNNIHLEYDLDIPINGKVMSCSEIRKEYKKGKLPIIDELKKEYDRFKPFIKLLEDEFKHEEKMEYEIKEKYNGSYFTKYKELMPDSIKNRINNLEIKGKSYFPYNSLNDRIHEMYFRGEPIFSSEMDRLLEDSNTPHWRIDFIHKRRLDAIELFGFEYSEEDYEEVIEDPKIEEFVMEMRDFSDKYLVAEKELFSKEQKEVKECSKYYKECSSILDSLNLIDKYNPLDDALSTGVSFYSQNYTNVDGRIISKPIIFINFCMNSIDKTLIHELNHAFEAHTIRVDEKSCDVYCGWEKNHIDFTDTEDKQKRDYELLNEYINEKISIEIYNIMKSSSKYMFTNDDFNSSSPYMSPDYLLGDFYNEYKDVIIESRSNGNLGYMIDYIGEENFIAINDLCNECILNDKFDHDDIDETPMYDKLLAKRDEIMNNIKTYRGKSL